VTAPDHSEVPTKVARHDTVYDVSFMPVVTGTTKLSLIGRYITIILHYDVLMLKILI